MAGLVRILSIDGGGIRGLIPGLVLERLEERVGSPIADMFHLVGGTSTGGILALGLTQPGSDGGPRLTAADAVALYEQRGSEIFQRSFWYGFSSLGGLTDAKYDAENVETVLREELGAGWISQSLTDLFVTAYDLENRKPRFLKSWKARGQMLRQGETAQARDFRAHDAGRATSAAPTYFDAAHVAARDDRRHCLVDGGVFANNPTLCAMAAARKRYPAASRYLIVSLGTGIQERPIPCEDASDWGLAQWARPITSVIFDGVSDTVDYQVAQMFPRGYHRFQCDLGRFDGNTRGPNDDLDDASDDNLRKLRRKGENMLKDQRSELTRLVRRLKKRRDDLPTVTD